MNDRLQADLQSRIESFAADVTALLQQAVATGIADALGSAVVGRAARAAQATRTATPAAKKSAKKSAKKTAKKSAKKGGKRAPADIAKLQTALLREVKREGGRRIELIAKAMGLTTHELKVPMQHLLSTKAVKAKGQARATNYTAK